VWADTTEFLSTLLGPVLSLIAPLHPVWQGAVLGVPIGVLALLIYRLTSDQADITRTKDGIKANLLALQLFRDDLRVLLRTQGTIFRLVGRYLRLGLIPLAILIVPVLLLLVQVEARHGHRPVQVGEATNVVIKLNNSALPTETPASLQATDTLRVETPAFRRDAERMIAWRVSATRPGSHEMEIHVGDDIIRRRLWVGDSGPELVVPNTYRTTDWRSLGSPGESAIDPHAHVEETFIDYQASAGVYGGLSLVSWSLFVTSLLAGFALRRRMHVDF
jgi:hypothetical protein